MFAWLFGKKTAPSTGMACVACDSTDVTELAPQTYRCNVCAYEGGDGFAAWQDMNTRAAYDDWSVAQLREHAAAQLNEARACFATVDGYTVPALGHDGPSAHIGSVTLTLGGTGQTNADERQAMIQRIQRETEEAADFAKIHLHKATLTMDALVDKGASELVSVLDEARSATVEPESLRRCIDNCLTHFG